MKSGPIVELSLKIAVLALAYALAGRAGLALPYIGSNITLFWPPTGIALAALFRWGNGCWPGVFLGAVWVNWWVGSSLATSLGIAIGNTLGPLLATAALRRLGFNERIEKHRDALLFLFVTAMSMMVPATGGTLTLRASGVISSDTIADAWRMWWLGDAMGALMVAPLFLTLKDRWWSRFRRQRWEFGLLYCSSLLASYWVFFRSHSETSRAVPLEFLTLPAVVWAALRFEAFGASLISVSSLSLAGIATALGHGPFYHPDIHQGLLLLWAFIATTGLIAFAIAPLQAERQRVDDALQETAARFRTVLETIREVVWVAQPGKIEPTYLSPAFARVWGQSIEACLQNPSRFLDSVHPEDREHFLAALAKQNAGESTSIEYRIVRPDGSIRWIWDQGFPICDAKDQLVVVNGIASDITERRQTELALEEQRRRLEGIINSSLDGIITIDSARHVVVFNPAAERMFQRTQADVLGTSIDRLISLCPPLEEALHWPAIDPASSVRGTLGNAQGRRRDGEEFPIEVSVSQVQVEDRDLFTLTCRDITERVRNEERRQRLEAQLRQAQKMDALGTLAGGIAHDFNNILGVILGQAELATGELAHHPTARQEIEEVMRAARRAKELVHHILTFSRQQTPERKVISLVPVIEETLSFLRATLPANIELNAAIEPKTPTVMADATSIHQVLVNLCTNAWHALEGKPGRIGIRLECTILNAERATKLRGIRPGRFARLSVSDSGKGIPAETVDRIFEPFFTTKEPGKGTGLGLSVVHGIMQAHEGAVTVTSEVGAGTLFQLYFPAVERVEEQSLPGGTTLVLGHGQRVLYVDDETSLVAVATRMLTRLGYSVISFTDPAEALRAIRNHPTGFDIVITDLNMPGLSGLELLRETHRLRPELPLILSSGYITEDLLQQTAALGIRHVLFKPTTLAELSEMLDRALSGSASSPTTPSILVTSVPPDPGSN